MKLNHTDFKNVATAEKKEQGNRYDRGRFVSLREATDKKQGDRFYVTVDAAPIHNEYLTYSKAAILFVEQFKNN